MLVVAFNTSPTLQTLRPPKNTFALVEIAIRGEAQGEPLGVDPGAGDNVSPSNIGVNPPTKYLPAAKPGGLNTAGGVLHPPAPPVSVDPLYTAMVILCPRVMVCPCF